MDNQEPTEQEIDTQFNIVKEMAERRGLSVELTPDRKRVVWKSKGGKLLGTESIESGLFCR